MKRLAHRRVLVLLTVLGMAAYLAVALAVDAATLRQGLAQLGWQGVAVVLGLSLVNYGLRFLRWALWLRTLGHRLPAPHHLACYLSGFALTVSPGKAGEALRGSYLHRRGVPWSHTLAALFAERLLDVLAICALVALTAGQLPGWRGPGLLLGGAVLLVALLLGAPALPQRLRTLAQRGRSRVHRALSAVAGWLGASAQLLAPRRLLPALALGVVAWGVEGWGLYWLAQGLRVDISPETATAIYAIGVLAGAAAFFIPGGLGSTEAAMTALLMASGAPLPVAFALTVLCRCATLWFAVALGLLALLVLEARPTAPTPALP